MTRAPYQPYITKEWQAKMHKRSKAASIAAAAWPTAPTPWIPPRLLRDQLHWYENFCQQHQSELG